MIISSGIKRVVYLEEYRISDGLGVLMKAGVLIEKFNAENDWHTEATSLFSLHRDWLVAFLHSEERLFLFMEDENMRKKFKIYTNAGKYKPAKDSMIVMNSEGLFFLVQFDFYTNIRPLHEVIGNYDVVWNDDNEK